MNDKYILKKDHLLGFLRKLNKEFRLIAPEKNSHSDTLFSEVTDIDNFDLDLSNQCQNSAKQFFLPQQETLFRYDTEAAAQYTRPPDRLAAPTVYFGLRSCDLAAILYMDVIFQPAKDSYYLPKRQNALLIGFNCNAPFKNCFCNVTRSGPFLEFGYDIQVTDLQDRYFFEAGRTNGQQVIDRWRHFFSPATEDDVRAQYQAHLEARGQFRKQVHIDRAMKQLADDSVPENIWQELSRRCQDCGGCGYICPTCTCFTIVDLPASETTGKRVRNWDSCTFSGFTGMAGGHNPVNRKTHGIQRRFSHKLLYDVKKHHRPSCVGCGRCVDICFGGVDIVRFINMVSETEG